MRPKAVEIRRAPGRLRADVSSVAVKSGGLRRCRRAGPWDTHAGRMRARAVVTYRSESLRRGWKASKSRIQLKLARAATRMLMGCTCEKGRWGKRQEEEVAIEGRGQFLSRGALELAARVCLVTTGPAASPARTCRAKENNASQFPAFPVSTMHARPPMATRHRHAARHCRYGTGTRRAAVAQGSDRIFRQSAPLGQCS